MKKTLLLCGFMLLFSLTTFIGLTYAWFNETITVENNAIKTGKLDVSFIVADNPEFTDARDLAIKTNKIFNELTLAPGEEVTKYVKVSNVGTIDLAYRLNLIGQSTNYEDESEFFNDHVSYTVTRFGETTTYPVESDVDQTSDYYALKPGHSDVYVITFTIHNTMENEGEGHSFDFNVGLKAKQIQEVEQMSGVVLWPDLDE